MAFVMLKKVSIISSRYNSIFRHNCLLNESVNRYFVSSNYFPTFTNKVKASYQENNLNEIETDPHHLTDKKKNSSRNSKNERRFNKGKISYTKNSYLQFLNEKLSKNEAVSSSVAFKIIKSCGSDMSGENEDTRNELVTQAWEMLKKSGIPMNIGLWNTLLSVYIENKRDFDPVDFLNDLRKNSQLEPNQTTFSLLIQMYAERGDPLGVMKIIEFMMEKGFVMTENMYAWLIKAFAINGNFEGVKHVMKSMRENGIPPKEKVYKQIINALAVRGDLEKIEDTLNEMTKKGISPTVELYMGLLNNLSEGGHRDLIKTTLGKIEGMQEMSPEVDSLIQRFTVREDYENAIVLLDHFKQETENMKPYTVINQISVASFNYLLQADKDLEQFKRLNNAIEKHFNKTLNSRLPFLAEYLAKNDKLDWALSLAVPDESLKRSNFQIYNFILKALNYKRDLIGIVKVFADMGEKSIDAEHSCYQNIEDTVEEVGSDKNNKFLDLAKDFDKIVLPYEFIKSVLSRENMNLNTFSKYAHLGSLGDLLGSIKEITDLMRRDFNSEDASKIVKVLHKKGIQTKVLIEKVVGDVSNRSYADVKEVYSFMLNLIQEGIPTTPNAQYNLLKGLFTFFRVSNSEYFFQFIRTLKEHGIEPDNNQQILMIRMAAKIGNSSAAQFCFDKLMAEPDLPGFYNENKNMLYQYLISSYQNEAIKEERKEKKVANARKILQIAAEMKEKDLKPTAHSASAIAVSHLINGDVAEANYFLSTYGSFEPTVNQRNLLNTAYLTTFISQGNFKAAEDKFNELILNNVVTYGHYKQMFRLCEIKGNVSKMEQLYSKLLENGMKADVNIYEHMIRTYLKNNQPECCLKLLKDNTDNQKQKLGTKLVLSVIRSLALNGIDIVKEAVALARKDYPNIREQTLKEVLLIAHIKDGLVDEASSFLYKNEVVTESESSSTRDNEGKILKQDILVGHLKKYAESAEQLGDIKFIENIIKFLKSNKLAYHVAYPSYLLALDKVNDIEGLRNLYKDHLENEVKENDQFISLLNATVEKHGISKF
nr:leucine-rich PPR motif-containing protein, mitochondrial [Hydra vulgaris]